MGSRQPQPIKERAQRCGPRVHGHDPAAAPAAWTVQHGDGRTLVGAAPPRPAAPNAPAPPPRGSAHGGLTRQAGGSLGTACLARAWHNQRAPRGMRRQEPVLAQQMVPRRGHEHSQLLRKWASRSGEVAITRSHVSRFLDNTSDF
jgi:hypothetical protein